MKQLDTENWQLQLPDEWRSEPIDEAMLIHDEDFVSEILVSTLELEVELEGSTELQQFAEEVAEHKQRGEWVTVGDYQAWRYQYTEQEDYVREWYITEGKQIVIISYACALDDKFMDDAIVDQILETLIIYPNQEQ